MISATTGKPQSTTTLTRGPLGAIRKMCPLNWLRALDIDGRSEIDKVISSGRRQNSTCVPVAISPTPSKFKSVGLDDNLTVLRDRYLACDNRLYTYEGSHIRVTRGGEHVLGASYLP